MLNFLAQSTLYTTETTTNSGMSPVVTILYLLIVVLAIVAMWKVFVKAGEAGWKSIIPIYNGWVYFEISGKPGWWVFVALIPIVGLILHILAALELAKRFGKSAVFAIFGLVIFSVIGFLMLGFGDAKYNKNAA